MQHGSYETSYCNIFLYYPSDTSVVSSRFVCLAHLSNTRLDCLQHGVPVRQHY